MGLIGELAKKAVVHVAKEKGKEIAMNAAVVGYKTVEAVQKEKEKGKLFTPTQNIRLFLRENESWKKGYDIFDQEYNHKYKVKAGVIAKKHLTLCNLSGEEIGHVESEWFAKNEFVIHLRNRSLGLIKPLPSGKDGRSWKKLYYKTDFNDWIVESNMWGTEYKVTKGNKLVFSFEKTSDIAHSNYMVDFTDKKDELIGLLIVIALEAKKRS